MDAIDMMLRYAPKAQEADLAGYPADVTNTIQAVCTLWRLQPPRTKGSKAYWIAQARELQDACAEFAVYELLDVVRRTVARGGKVLGADIVVASLAELAANAFDSLVR